MLDFRLEIKGHGVSYVSMYRNSHNIFKLSKYLLYRQKETYIDGINISDW